MQIFFKSPSGTLYTLELEESCNVAELKALIESKLEIPTDELSISYCDKILEEDELMLSDFGIETEATLNANFRLLGGAKKRKKKVYTKPKKKKHVHKKRKLAILNYYRIDKDGKISRIKLECEKCGSGVFMAEHKDRHHCGKCGNLFYKVKKAGDDKKKGDDKKDVKKDAGKKEAAPKKEAGAKGGKKGKA